MLHGVAVPPEKGIAARPSAEHQPQHIAHPLLHLLLQSLGKSGLLRGERLAQAGCLALEGGAAFRHGGKASRMVVFRGEARADQLGAEIEVIEPKP